MSFAARQIERVAREKNRQRRAQNPGMNLGQMNFEGFALAEKKRSREWRGVPKFTPEDDEDGTIRE